MKKDKLNLLVIPGMFPADASDIRGVFVIDYLRAAEPFCNITVLDNRITGRKAGLAEEQLGSIRILRLALTTHAVSARLKPFHYLRWFVAGYRTACNLGEIDVIHAHGSTLAGSLALMVGRRMRAPVVITEHTGPFSKLLRGPLSTFLTRRAMEKAACVLVVSDDLRRQVLNAGIRPRRLEVSFNPVDTGLFDLSNRPAPADRRNVLFVGRLEPYKGALRSVLAFQGIARDHLDWRMTVVGGGPEATAIETLLAADEALRGRVRLTGHLSKEEIAREMNRAALLIFPSEHETFGLVVAEAMACGLPVIIGDHAAPIEFVDDHAGIRVPAGDVGQLSSTLRYMIGNLGNYDSATIRRSIVQRFGLDAFGRRLRTVYETL